MNWILGVLLLRGGRGRKAEGKRREAGGRGKENRLDLLPMQNFPAVPLAGDQPLCGVWY